MEMKIQIPFQQLLTIVKTLTPSQKAKLKKELEEKTNFVKSKQEDFIDLLLNGPVYSAEDIATIKENRKSIAAWRTKN